MDTSRNLSYQFTPQHLKRQSGRFRPNISGRSSIGSPLELSAWKSPFHSSRRQSSLSQSFQNLQVIAETPTYTAEQYGAILPVLVTEALTTSDRHVTISVKMADSGWAWLVCGRRLFIWKYVYQQSDQSRNNVTYCRELTLPPSDLAHKTELVNVLRNKSSQAPSALAVSPEGIVRYWANIAHEGASFETVIDLQGQECFSLLSVEPLGCILATTTSSLVQLVPTIIDGQNTVFCRILRVPHGMLAGFGRRVSSFIFGTVPNQSSECKQLSRVLCEDGLSEEQKSIYVLTGNTLQKWQITGVENETLTHEVDLERDLTQGFASSSEVPAALDGRLKARVVDMQLAGNGRILVLAESSNGTELFYAFATVEFNGKLLSFCMLKHVLTCSRHDDFDTPCYQLLLSDPSSEVAYVYNDSTILCASTSTGDVECIQFNAAVREQVLGAGSCQRLSLFFISTHGIISVTKNDYHANTSRLLEMTIEEATAEQPTDDASKLKTALVFFCKNKTAESQCLVDDFLSNIEQVPCTNSTLDLVVEKLSREMVDDHPASDPRWAESVPGNFADCATSSVIVLHQLADKLRAHELLLSFLKMTGLWENLSIVNVQKTSRSTAMSVRENAEKLKAAMALKGLEGRHGKAIDASINKATAKRAIPHGLTAKDVFYQEVSKIGDIFPALFEVEQNLLGSDSDAVDTLNNVNSVFLEIIRAVVNYRQTTADKYEGGESTGTKHVSWTSLDSLRTIFKDQHRMTAEHVSDDSFGSLSQQLLDLTDAILDSYQHQLATLPFPTNEYSEVDQEYVRERKRLLHVLMEKGQFERTASLAEKYCDFGVLIELCEKTDNRDRLQRYMKQFSDQNFAGFAFKWYLDEGKRGKLLSFSNQSELSRFLKNHDGLSWLHQVNIGEFVKARNTLRSLAANEKQFASRKKTLLGLAKLAAIISTDAEKDDEINDINIEQDLLLYQETLPAPVLEAYGLDTDSMRVLAPEELVEMYISEENEDANEYDFKKALDLASNNKTLQLHIWCQAILRDSWNDMNTDEPLESLRNTLFFRIIDLAFTQNVDLSIFLPTIESLLESEELGSLSHNPNLAFLVKAGYEYLAKMLG